MRNKDIAMIHLHYFSSPLLHLHPDLFQQVTWYSTLSLSLFFSLQLPGANGGRCPGAIVRVCIRVRERERERWFSCWMTVVQGHFGDGAALPKKWTITTWHIQTETFRPALRGAAVLTRCMSQPIQLCTISCPVECCCVSTCSQTHTHTHTFQVKVAAK